MKIAIFYRDICTTAAEALEFFYLADALAEKHDVVFWGKDYKNLRFQHERIQFELYGTWLDLLQKLPAWFEKHSPDLVIVLGFFTPQNLLVSTAARQRGVTVALHPLGQVADPVFAGKMFAGESNIQFMKGNCIQPDTIVQQIKVAVNPYLKLIYKHLLGSILVGQSEVIVVSSQEEQQQFQRHFNRPNQDFITLLRGVIPTPLTDSQPRPHFYRKTLGYEDQIPNLVFWSRIEWHYKGLDRLLEGVKVLRDRLSSEQQIPFRLFLIGPDYRGGTLKALDFIERHHLQSMVSLLPPTSYPTGSKAPLEDADALVLLSRWDTGLTRTIREAVSLGIPVMVTRSTHFGEVVEQYGCGILVDSPDDPDVVAASLLMLVNPQKRASWHQFSNEIRQLMTWKNTAVELLDQFNVRLLSQGLLEVN